MANIKKIFESYFCSSNESPNYNIYFYLFTGFHLFLWTIIPALIRHNINLDSIEAIAWGHEWQLGYDKHPPMSAWLSEAMIVIFNKKIWSIYFLSQVCVIITFIAVWKLAKLFLPQDQAFLATIILESVYYYNFTSVEFNPNVLMLPIWAWTSYYAWRIYDQNRLIDWLCLSLIAAIGVLSKYIFVILLFCFGLMLCYERRIDRYLKKPGPYLAALIFLIAIYPHIKWLIDSDFITIKYARESISNNYHYYNHLLLPLLFFITQLFSLSFAIFIFLSLRPKKIIDLKGINSDRKALFLIFMGIVPSIIIVLPSIISASKIKDMWGTQLWNLFGITLFYFFKPMICKEKLRVFYKKWLIISCLPIIIYIVVVTAIPNKYADFRGDVLAQKLTSSYRKQNNNRPLEIVAGSTWLASNIGLFSPDRPQVFIDMNVISSPWISGKKFEEKGGIIIWNAMKEGYYLPERFQNKFNNKIIEQGIIELPSTKKSANQFIIGWAIAKPS